MNTILNICESLKGFGNHIIENNTLRDGYVDLFVLLGIVGLVSIILHIIERSDT